MAAHRRAVQAVWLLLWTALAATVLYSVNVWLTSTAPLASRHDYVMGYSAAFLGLSLLMAALLVGVTLASDDPRRVRLATFLPPAFLLATVLHIAAWGVSASKWLVTQQPELGSALWTFLLLGGPITAAIVSFYMMGMAATGPERTEVSTT